MLIVPDRLNKYTGVPIIDENNNQVGNFYTIAQVGNSRKCIEAQRCSLIRPYFYGQDFGFNFSNDTPASVISQPFDNSPEEYSIARPLIYRYKRYWLVQKDTEFYQMSEDSFNDAIRYGISDKRFNCTFVWVYNNGTYDLVRAGSKFHCEAIEETTLRSKKPLKKKELIVGGIYKDMMRNETLYLGHVSSQTSYYGHNSQIKPFVGPLFLYFNAYSPFVLSKAFPHSITNRKFSPRVLIDRTGVTLQDVKDYVTKNNIIDYGLIVNATEN